MSCATIVCFVVRQQGRTAHLKLLGAVDSPHVLAQLMCCRYGALVDSRLLCHHYNKGVGTYGLRWQIHVVWAGRLGLQPMACALLPMYIFLSAKQVHFYTTIVAPPGALQYFPCHTVAIRFLNTLCLAHVSPGIHRCLPARPLAAYTFVYVVVS